MYLDDLSSKYTTGLYASAKITKNRKLDKSSIRSLTLSSLVILLIIKLYVPIDILKQFNYFS